MGARVLVVDDQHRVRASIAERLDEVGFSVTTAASGSEALKLLEEREFVLALIDVKMPEMDGLELLRRIRARWAGIPVILITAYASIPSAVGAMKMGASHYLEKPFTKETLLDVVNKALAEYGVGQASGAEKGSPFQDFVGSTPALADVLELARRSAATDKPVLLLGEIGTGRETLARAVHAASPRAGAPFIPVRCFAARDDLDADLFGTASGSGRLVDAAGGTLYLDSVADLPPESQAKLTRYVQDGEVPREAGLPAARSDARVMASNADDLEELVKDGMFREDLFVRLKAVTLRLPPLRERRSDLPRLVQHFVRKHRQRGGPQVKFSREACKVLAALPFRGNLKELQDVTEQASALALSGEVTPEVLFKLGIRPAEAEESETHAMRSRIEQEEKKAIEEELRRNPRNLKQTAKNLNISRTTLWRKMKKYSLEGK
ncbi:MAG: sigma-54-dependent Fis family transcriptional regulator [Planctomycetes bacterium]|nr:sigma-54-dependent Fis family transcriptional regulator [Planctomycetota bacterium]